MKRLIVATNNKGKIIEIKKKLEGINIEVLSLQDLGLDIDVPETADTLDGNAILKASTISDMYPNDIVIADDSGLFIDALNGEPGVFSARYLGEDTPYSEKMQNLIKRLEGQPNRAARFITCIAVCRKGKSHMVFTGYLEGTIAHKPIGTNGFAYDPFFFIKKANKTLGEMTLEEKIDFSHRSMALDKVVEYLKQLSQMVF